MFFIFLFSHCFRTCIRFFLQTLWFFDFQKLCCYISPPALFFVIVTIIWTIFREEFPLVLVKFCLILSDFILFYLNLLNGSLHQKMRIISNILFKLRLICASCVFISFHYVSSKMMFKTNPLFLHHLHVLNICVVVGIHICDCVLTEFTSSLHKLLTPL